MSAAHGIRTLPRALRLRFGTSGLIGVISGLLLLGGGWFGLARVLVHQCAAIDGPLADLGQALTLLQTVPDCPAGTMAVLPGVPQTVVLLFALALPMVAAHAALGAVGVGLVALLRRTTSLAVDLLAAVLPNLRSLGRLRVRLVGRACALVGPRSTTMPAGVPGNRHPLRGPPLAMA
ncbi:hypothetical protein [Cellulomonas sp. NPDC089187]|uniref:hypothetical protein n=1 Tax=Cellulomonas sp. NPDC089187 TaxID=3154970 RepID=UPI00343D9595